MIPDAEPVRPPPGEDWSALVTFVKQFEEAWRQGARPALEDHLPADGPLRARALIELVHIDLELRLKDGEAARAEEYLARYPELARDCAAAVELIAAEHALRRRAEPHLTTDDYLERFPQYRQELLAELAATTAAGSARRDTPCPESPPLVLGYEVLGELGRGGMGVVYKARQLSLNRLVALKFLPEEYARDRVWLERFQREARTASALNHPHICTIYDTGDCAGRPFLSMELIDGQTLGKLVLRRPGAGEVARLIGQAARALSAAHAAGVVHRDIKPQNLMVRADGIVKVLDFGLARRLLADGAADPMGDTDPGTRAGTVLYMSPEQARGSPVGTASDIFSLGIVLYELATGQHPFAGLTEAGIVQAIINLHPLPIARLNPEVPAALYALVEQMMAKDPHLRPTATRVDAALADLAGTGGGLPEEPPAPRPERPVTVGREADLIALRSAFESAAAGCGLLLCVTGEPGLGKTTLVEEFLAELAAGGRAHSLARGRCSERLAGTEAYLPFLEALDSLIQGDGGAAVAQRMKAVAPTWYVQLAPLAADDPALAPVLAEVKGASQERRKRELGLFLHEMSSRRPLVVFLDDVHWADPSSIDLLAYLGSKCAGLRLLLVLTYRPSDLALSNHPFGPVKLELQGRGVCREIALRFLSRDDFDRYLALAFAGHQFPDELTAVLHARTEGNPLFMVDLLRYLRDRGVIVQDHGRWALVRAVPDLQRELPESVRGLIQRKVEQLSTADRHLLMAASVQGPEFDSTVVAQLLGREAADVEERLDVLERVHVMVRLIREQAFPDGALTLRYGFVHALYQNTLYAALQPTRKAAWSAAAARTLLSHHGEKDTSLAAELALLFEAARDYERAADHFLMAAENAARIFAHHEAVALARRGLAMVERLPNTSDRSRRELPLLLTLGVQLQVVQGYAAPEPERTYDRARALCERVQEAPEFFLVLWGLWMLYEVRSDLKKSRALAEQLLALAQRAQDRAQLLQAHMALTVTFFSLGELAAVREHAEQGVALYDPGRHGSHTHLYGQNPKVVCLAFGAVSLWLLGYPDQARERSREAVALGEDLGHPTSRALALAFAAMLRQYCRDPVGVQESADATTVIATEHRLSLWLADGLVMGGWAVAEQGASARGIAMLRQGLADWSATGAETHRTYFLGLLADALGKGGQIEEGLSVLTEALAQFQGTGTAFHGAELHRLQGELLLRAGGVESPGREAEACFGRALTVARRQQARSLELRAAMSLTRLYQKQGRQAEVRPMLAECYHWFTEGLDTTDLREARALLEQTS
jgi:predicted ATPase/predicted Ser/Thr protein kinase